MNSLLYILCLYELDFKNLNAYLEYFTVLILKLDIYENKKVSLKRKKLLV